MKINQGQAKYSMIVDIGDKIREVTSETGQTFLLLNRGVNSVKNIDLSAVVKQIDFNTNSIQVYPPTKGRGDLIAAINKEYFFEGTNPENIYVTPGGIGALDLVFQTIRFEQVFIPAFYWGAYTNIFKLRNVKSGIYLNFQYLKNNLSKLKNAGVIICDPSNPLGNKSNDAELLELLDLLDKNNTTVIVDCPYRKLFTERNDSFFHAIRNYENVVICESFSKWLGLSGQRIGFIHAKNIDFLNELRIRLLYCTNGTNTFAQILVEKLLTSAEGRLAVENFRKITLENIKKNIDYLKQRNFLPEWIYNNELPIGIFVAINKSHEYLFDNLIGSVPLHFFTVNYKEETKNYSRICVSVPHDSFASYFDKL